MVNRFLNLIEARTKLQNDYNDPKRKRSPKHLTDIMIGIKRLTYKIINFGRREKIIHVTVQYTEIPNNGLGIEEKEVVRVCEFYFTGIETFEAIECVRFKMGEGFVDATATELPVGKPIKI